MKVRGRKKITVFFCSFCFLASCTNHLTLKPLRTTTVVFIRFNSRLNRSYWNEMSVQTARFVNVWSPIKRMCVKISPPCE